MEETEKILINTISETSKSENGGEPLPKGTTIESTLQAETEQPPAVKRGRGRPKGSKNKSGKQQQPDELKRTDGIAPMLNGMVIPMAAKKLKRKPEDLMFSKDEMEYLETIQPPLEMFDKPSWPKYIITAVSMVLIKFYQSEEIKKAAPAKAETQGESRKHPEAIIETHAEVMNP